MAYDEWENIIGDDLMTSQSRIREIQNFIEQEAEEMDIEDAFSTQMNREMENIAQVSMKF